MITRTRYFMLRMLALAACLHMAVAAAAQHRGDNTWVFGYDEQVSEEYDSLDIAGGSIIEFLDNEPLVFRRTVNMDMRMANASMSDSLSGQLLAVTNGYYVLNQSSGVMVNGTELSENIFNNYSNCPQGTLMLPFPGQPHLTALIHGPVFFFDPPVGSLTVGMHPLYHSLIDPHAANGQGAVFEKNTVISTDTFDIGKISAVRHANGRDWWVLVPGHDKPWLKRLLLTPAGVEDAGYALLDAPFDHGLGQTTFSPDGRWYAHVSVQDAGYFITVLGFDRCTGEFSQARRLVNSQTGIAASGVAFSPSSRYLYVSLNRWIYQYDLEVPELADGQQLVAEYDGFRDTFPGLGGWSLPTTFNHLQLGPDGRIYGNTTNSVRYLHVIHAPDEPGLLCQVRQHDLLLPTLNLPSLPNFPNYRLGPLADSACDSLTVSTDPAPPAPQQAVWLYPNPADDYLGVRLATAPAAPLQLVLLDAQGRVVRQHRLAGQDQLFGVSDLPGGVYFYVLHDAAGRSLARGKWIKLR